MNTERVDRRVEVGRGVPGTTRGAGRRVRRAAAAAGGWLAGQVQRLLFPLAAAGLAGGCSGANGCDPCVGPAFLDRGTPIASTVEPRQIHALGDYDGDGTRDLLSLSVAGELRVLRGPDFGDEIAVVPVPGITANTNWRYRLSVLDRDPRQGRSDGLLYILDTTTGKIAGFRIQGGLQALPEISLSLAPEELKALNQTSAFAAVEQGPPVTGGAVFVIAYTFLTSSGYVELEFWKTNGEPFKNPECVGKPSARNICVTQIPAEGEVEYLLTDWDGGSHAADRAEMVDVISSFREPDRTVYSIWYGEDDWTAARRLELSAPLRLDDDSSRLASRPIVLLVGSDSPLGGRGGVGQCPFLGPCTCGVSTRSPTLFALNRCHTRAPSGGPEIYRLNQPTTIAYEAPWLRDYPCPSGQPLDD